MNLLIIVVLSLALAACVTWFVTWRYFQVRLTHLHAERERERLDHVRATELLDQQIKLERRERRHVEDQLRERRRSGRR